MRFSIIIPNYNGGQYLQECLDSIFNQTIDKSKYEVLLIDDGSTDNSLEIASKYDVKVFKTNRKKAGGARNKGLDNATGEYILFLDSDDYFYSHDTLEKLDNYITDEDSINLPILKQRKDSVEFLSNNGMTLEEKIEKTGLLACFLRCVKLDILKDVRFPENCYFEDIYFTIETFCNVKKESNFPEPVVFYRYAENSITKQTDGNSKRIISPDKMTDLVMQIINLYHLCEKYPQYSPYIISRIKNDSIQLRLDILNEYFETGYNSFFDNYEKLKRC